MESVGGRVGFHQSQRAIPCSIEHGTVSTFQFHGRAGVDVQGYPFLAVLLASRFALSHGLGKSEDDTGYGEKAHQQYEPVADAVSGPGFHAHLFQECGLGEGDLAVATEAEQVNQYR